MDFNNYILDLSIKIVSAVSSELYLRILEYDGTNGFKVVL